MTDCDYDATNPAQSAALDLPEGVPPLRSFYLYLSNSCNLACRHCWITPHYLPGAVPETLLDGARPQAAVSPGDVIDVAALRLAVAEARPLGLSSAKLTGGEPMLHPRFLEIVDMLTEAGLSLNMETNGTLLTPETARYLKEQSKIGFISISLDGADAATHDDFRSVPGAFAAALHGLDALVAAGYRNTQVIMSVHRGNRGQVEAVLRLAAEHGAGSVKLNPVTNSGRGAGMHERGEDLDFDERLELARTIHTDLRRRAPIPVLLNMPPALTPLPEIQRRQGATGDCGVLGILGILGTGEIALCGIGRTISELVYGRLGQDSIREIWLSHPTILALRRQLAEVETYPGICRQCVHASQCRTGCVAQNYVDGQQLVWPSWLCEKAQQRGAFPATRRKQPYDKISEIGN